MLDAISDARAHDRLLTFVYWNGEIGTEFARAARGTRAGRRTRAACCSTRGARTRWSARSSTTWTGPACTCVGSVRCAGSALGTVNHRTHRKVMVVDESVGFTGGVGIADEWHGDARNAAEWRDTHFRIRGPAVDGLRAAFLDNWVETDPELFDERVDRFPDQPKPGETLVQCVRGASETGWSDVATLFRTLLQIGTQLRPHHDRVLRPGRGDHRATVRRGATAACRCRSCCPARTPTSASSSSRAKRRIAELLDAGVELWNFQPSMMHAKVMTVDGVVANIGSANLNARSTACDEEINVVALDPDARAGPRRTVRRGPRAQHPDRGGRWKQRSLPAARRRTAVTPLRRWF